jgi:hypothetical protein
MLKKLELEDLILAINILDDYFSYDQFDEYSYIFENTLRKAINDFIDDFSVSEYCEGKDINQLIDENKTFDGTDININKEKIYHTVKDWIKKEICSKINYYLDDINSISLNKPNIPDIDQDYSDEIDNIIYSYLESDHDSWRDNSYDPNINYEKDIEIIFER